MHPPSVIEISRSALEHNYRFLRHHLGDEVTISAVVKGNAYGHGLEEFVPLAEASGVRHFSVFSAGEARRATVVLQEPETRLCIMGYIDDDELEWAVAHDVEFWVFDLARLDAAIAAAARLGKQAQVHLEVETGLHRTGLGERGLAAVAQRVKAHREQLRVCGVCTHLAGAESQANYRRIQTQIERFGTQTARLWRLGIRPRRRHLACSAAALSYPETRGDMCRIGIAQYGFWPSREIYIDYVACHGKRGKDPLQRVLSWKTRVLTTKSVKAGEFIGYGTSYLPEQKTRLAVVPVGYASGFARSLSNRGRVLVRGRRASVVGLVNMNMALVNVTNIPGVSRGDEVVLVGSQGRLTITVGSFTDLAQMHNYELLVSLPESIPRKVVD